MTSRQETADYTYKPGDHKTQCTRQWTDNLTVLHLYIADTCHGRHWELTWMTIHRHTRCATITNTWKETMRLLTWTARHEMAGSWERHDGRLGQAATAWQALCYQRQPSTLGTDGHDGRLVNVSSDKHTTVYKSCNTNNNHIGIIHEAVCQSRLNTLMLTSELLSWQLQLVTAMTGCWPCRSHLVGWNLMMRRSESTLVDVLDWTDRWPRSLLW